MNDEELKQRYQFQPWYIKLWRRRWYLTIPYWTLRTVLNEANKEFSIKDLWGISTGMAQSQMGWYYTIEETKARLESRKRARRRQEINKAINEAKKSGAYEVSEHLSGSGAWLDDKDEENK